jgi:hypothetical protein
MKVSRRIALAFGVTLPFSTAFTAGQHPAAMAVGERPSVSRNDLAALERERIMREADAYLVEWPLTITSSRSRRSAGGPHDFFSEADYWWPDPDNPSAPYIQRDGLTNPDNFVDHRRLLMRLSVQVPALAAAWKISGDRRFAMHAGRHLHAWFLNEQTRMNPHLQYAQAIRGRVTGRGIGIIDTIHLVEVVRAIETLEPSGILSGSDIAGVKQWFAEYLHWMTTHPYGLEEREAKNNHGTCWAMQVGAFARLTGDRQLAELARTRFKTVILPGQMAPDGSFPLELKRTKPYAYSLFNLEAMSAICQLLSTAEDDLWTFELPDGRGMRKALSYFVPYIQNKIRWPYPADVMFHEHWPMRQTSLLFGGLALHRPQYVHLWRRLPADSTIDEVIRNFFIRQPVLWVSRTNGR